MNTLTALNPLLTRLFAESEHWMRSNAAWLDLPPDELNRRMQSKTDYLSFYHQLKDAALAVSPETGRLLYLLARGAQAHCIVEFGTSFGISALHLAAALRDNGGGRLITCEFEPSKVQRARQHLDEAGLADLVDIREGDALLTLQADQPASVDLLLLDGAKGLYLEVFGTLEDRLRPGAFIVADNAEYSPDYLAYVRDPANGYVSVPFAEDVELSVRVF
ncbi:O-methyltransferase [Pseudomonas sp. KNUC1026]|uniref:O-methyltransferase n=1 Tax=Pseudomonas sp. KNUC1026 TaxID=2893890 RepID=UPI001F30838E|nr:class I SAM-dependent methyltransferase [Pseudomonas sp. KNUC1026]UFH50892.1 class I SAM-dependent methyltransferase [Pseudomonas sp. KNUC1026]